MPASRGEREHQQGDSKGNPLRLHGNPFHSLRSVQVQISQENVSWIRQSTEQQRSEEIIRRRGETCRARRPCRAGILRKTLISVKTFPERQTNPEK